MKQLELIELIKEWWARESQDVPKPKFVELAEKWQSEDVDMYMDGDTKYTCVLKIYVGDPDRHENQMMSIRTIDEDGGNEILEQAYNNFVRPLKILKSGIIIPKG